MSVEISRPADVPGHRNVPSFSPWKRAWMGGVLISHGDVTQRVGGWLFDEDAEELRALIEGARPAPTVGEG